MPKVVYIEPDENRRELDVPVGYSVMEGATMNSVEGIEAECGGACSCATCHAYIDEAWLDKLPRMEGMEDSMLERLWNVSPTAGSPVRYRSPKNSTGLL